MDTNRIKFNFFLLKNLFLLYLFSVIIISMIDSSPFVLIVCWLYLLLSLPVFLFNMYEIRHNRIISYIVFSGLNLVHLISYLKEIFTKKTVTGWQNINGILVKHTKTYYYYETDSGTVYFNLISAGIFLVLQFFVWMIIIKKMSQFEIDLE
ncbi:hypothetical protein IQ05_00707 [Flavobacterium tiangeerense]|uniref:Uncharacterized protein n=1 Tax=Flavobacterium tiangeerense TaxID=459471 RepID=A0ABY3FLK9_9FLAO|nr:hypothetical protein [Flavobacterium tiangeerense]TWI01140.1 hypothetical protein IQ05_00707 [Flavobacterium tiangeerense]